MDPGRLSAVSTEALWLPAKVTEFLFLVTSKKGGQLCGLGQWLLTPGKGTDQGLQEPIRRARRMGQTVGQRKVGGRAKWGKGMTFLSARRQAAQPVGGASCVGLPVGSALLKSGS